MQRFKRTIKYLLAFAGIIPVILCSSLSAYAEVGLPRRQAASGGAATTRQIEASGGAATIVQMAVGDAAEMSEDTELPPGTVAGLPDGLIVLDEDGTPVDSTTGEYFFQVENMEPGVAYSKDIQIINRLEQHGYKLYIYAELVDKSGEIDLENECEAVITLNDTEIYRGLVNGKGNVDMTDEPIYLGLYDPGATGNLKCTITWEGADAGGAIDNGHILISDEGITTLREESGNADISGEVRFKWIFYAVLDDENIPPETGFWGMSKTTEIILLTVTAGMVCGMLILTILKKRRKDSTGQ